MSERYLLDAGNITCRICGMTSHNPNDATHRYCGKCHVFLDDLTEEQFRELLAATDCRADAAARQWLAAILRGD